jgi:DNA-binding NarL/FixJ family response regulator
MNQEKVVEISSKNEVLEAKNVALVAKNVALEAKNKTLELEKSIDKMKEREKINNKANWHKRGNKPWKKEVIRAHKSTGYSNEEIADLYNITPQTVKAHSDKN